MSLLFGEGVRCTVTCDRQYKNLADVCGVMTREVKLSRVDNVLDELSYPIPRDDAAVELEGVTLLLADGEANLGELVSETGSDSYSSTDDLKSELHNSLPREAVGEPYQSEGEG